MGDMGNPCEVAKGAAVGHWGQMVISFSFLHSFKTFYCNASQFMNCISIKWTENRLLGNCFHSMCFHETYLVRFSTLNRPICVLLATFQWFQCSGCPKGTKNIRIKKRQNLLDICCHGFMPILCVAGKYFHCCPEKSQQWSSPSKLLFVLQALFALLKSRMVGIILIRMQQKTFLFWGVMNASL